MNTWRAGCGESRTSGSEGGPEKPTSRKAGRALRPDPYSHFSACEASPVVYGIVDVASRKWIVSLLCAEQTGSQVKVVFLAGLEAEGLLADLEWRLDVPGDVDLDEPAAPVLLAVSDNGPSILELGRLSARLRAEAAQEPLEEHLPSRWR